MTRRRIGPRLRLASLGMAMVVLLLGLSSLSAQGASSIAQGFQTTDNNVVTGALVSLKDDSPNTVELSTVSNLEALIGVAGNRSLIELSNGSGAVQVVTNGTTPTLVSDINGDIRTGDKITASPIAGVGMKATTSTLIVGTAQADLDTSKAEVRSITDKKGRKQDVHIAAITLQVDKVFYQIPDEQNTFLPPAFQDFANSIAGRQVSPVRVLLAGMLVVLLFVVITILLYSSVRSSIISIGRNPLSENAVHKSLLEVGLTVAGILVFTVIIIYLILTT